MKELDNHNMRTLQTRPKSREVKAVCVCQKDLPSSTVVENTSVDLQKTHFLFLYYFPLLSMRDLGAAREEATDTPALRRPMEIQESQRYSMK